MAAKKVAAPKKAAKAAPEAVAVAEPENEAPESPVYAEEAPEAEPAKAGGKKAEKDIRKFIAEHPTASDAQVASEVGADRSLVMDVRSAMGAKHEW